jgi:hypothetical protein
MQMIDLDGAAEWLATDIKLLTSPDGWTAAAGAGFPLWRRSMVDNPNDLFLWRHERLNAPPRRVHAALTHQILAYHQHWTREFRGGELVRELSRNAKIFYQWFDPGIPGITKRDLCYLMVEQELENGALLASYRSVPEPPRGDFERIDWWGASLCVPGSTPGTCAFSYLDREDQGGRFPVWLMNRMMPRYLRMQRDGLARFFADGGPPELVDDTMAGG